MSVVDPGVVDKKPDELTVLCSNYMTTESSLDVSSLSSSEMYNS